jgi:hypothetical protein
MTPEPLPPAAEPAYLTEALRRSGSLASASVTDVTVESVRTTILSRIIRLGLTYSESTVSAPRSIILKTAPEKTDVRWSEGRREVEFYQQVASVMEAPLLPRCFDAAWDAETNAWHLLLEDLTDSHFTSQDWPLPATLGQNKQILAARARFHAAWWDDPRLGVSIGAWRDDDSRRLQRFAEEVARFADRLGDRLSQERRDLYRLLIDSGHRLNARHRSHHNMTIVQGDAHVWNVFLPRRPEIDDVRFFDWDSWRIDLAADDLSYMMALHWFPDCRRRCERQLLDHYHTALLACGVGNYDRRALDDDYRRSVLWQIAPLCGSRPTTSPRGSGGSIWSASSWPLTISAVASS